MSTTDYTNFEMHPQYEAMRMKSAVEQGRQTSESHGLGLIGDIISGGASFITGTLLSGGNPVMGAVAAVGTIAKKHLGPEAGAAVGALGSLAAGGGGGGSGVSVDSTPVDSPTGGFADFSQGAA
jgi:hypothetical protein